MTKQSIRSKIVKNFIFGNFSTILNKVGSLIFLIILARMLKPELFGIYNLTISITMFLIFLTDSGTFGGIVKNLAEQTSKGDYESVRSYVRYIFRIKLLLVLFFAISLLLLSGILSNFVFKNSALLIPLRLASLFIVIFGILEFLNSIFYGIQSFSYTTLKEVIFQASRIIILLGIFYFFGVTITNSILAFILSSAITSLVLLHIIIKKFKPVLFGKIKKINKGDLTNYLLFFTLGSLSLVIFSYTDIITIGYFLPSEYVAYYSTSLSIIFGISTILSVQFLFFPLFAETSKEKLTRIFNISIRWVALVTIPATMGVLLLRKQIVILFFGQEYLPTVLPLTILSFIIFEIGATSLFSSLFYARNLPRHPAYILTVSSLINLVLNLVLITFLIKIKLIYGIMGVAIATTISRYLNLTLLVFYAKRKLDVSLHISSFYKQIIASLIMYAILYVMPLNKGYIGAIFTVSLGIAIYFLLMILIKGINLSELLQLRKALAGILRNNKEATNSNILIDK